MASRLLKIPFLILICLFASSVNSYAEDGKYERHVKVAMRMIGHQLLLQSEDTVSRVLPITMDGDRYRIQFESELEINPGNMVWLIDSMVQEAQLAQQYFVEVEQCATHEVMHSYEINSANRRDIIPCGTRPLPTDCYEILISLVDTTMPVAASRGLTPVPSNDTSAGDGRVNPFVIIASLITLLLLGAVSIYFWRNKKGGTQSTEAHLVNIGAYRFDQRNMELSLNENKIDLTSKEADLLSLLHTSANTTVEREHILKIVWGDEGDYVGRTLDVFISKLRKKLEADASIKIVNTRGVGYKLVVND